jgi:CBS domain-containing protein
MCQQSVADWMSTPPITVAPSTSLEAAQRLMRQRHVRRLPVVAEGQLIGIVTWGDLRAAQPSAATALSMHEWRALLDKVTVAACMTPDPLAVAPGASVLEAARLILDHHVGGLPVVAHGSVVGVITESDLFRLLFEVGGAEAGCHSQMRAMQAPEQAIA